MIHSFKMKLHFGAINAPFMEKVNRPKYNEMPSNEIPSNDNPH